MKTWISVPVTIAGAAIVLSSVTAAAPQADKATLPLPLRMSAFAVSMATAAPGATAVMDIRVKRWSTPAERENLINTAVEKGQDALLRALQKMPDHGRISIPGWTGPDPHNARLGWTLHYAYVTPGEDGGYRVGIATDRYIGMWEARNQPRTIDYPFSLIEIRLGKDGKGVGKMAVATKIEFDKKKKQLVLENYSSEPVRLNEVKIEK
ncbi:MAG TPA: hypothetical protein VL882_00360 [Vicinamibacterales bacterium]|jgi:hypothetical protein|nr:hypothetical protein [Vicinamibacterales bacterium]